MLEVVAVDHPFPARLAREESDRHSPAREEAKQARRSDVSDETALAIERHVPHSHDAGGQGDTKNHLPERSAAIKIVDREVYPDVDVRVDSHATAVEELRRVLEEYKLYEGFYRDRGRNPA